MRHFHPHCGGLLGGFLQRPDPRGCCLCLLFVSSWLVEGIRKSKYCELLLASNSEVASVLRNLARYRLLKMKRRIECMLIRSILVNPFAVALLGSKVGSCTAVMVKASAMDSMLRMLFLKG